MVKREVLLSLMDEKKVRVLRTVLSSKEELYLKEIASKSNVSLASTFRILQKFTAEEILQKREWKTSKVYSCPANAKVKFLQELFAEEYDGLAEFIEKIKHTTGVQKVIQHGAQKKGRANVLIIGKEINAEAIDSACQQVREKGFELSFLTLTLQQYEQMAKMGLYSGEKKILLKL